MAESSSSSSPTPSKLVRQRSNGGKKSSGAKYILGIDVGTTSVKISLVDAKTGEAVDKFVKDTLAGAASDCGPAGDLQVYFLLKSPPWFFDQTSNLGQTLDYKVKKKVQSSNLYFDVKVFTYRFCSQSQKQMLQ